jgi:hypothetical protein
MQHRLQDDARSFAKEVMSLDEDGFISRTLAILGLAKDSDKVTETEEEQSPGPAAASGWPPWGEAPDLFVEYTARDEVPHSHNIGTAHPGLSQASNPASREADQDIP